jgi:ADP-glucose pyrophosphorylase
MKKENSGQGKAKRSADDWVLVARKFGEECVKIQQNSKLDLDQKLQKQKELSDKMAKEIQEDSHLAEDEKRQMIASIDNYLGEWKALHDQIQQSSGQKTSKQDQKK